MNPENNPTNINIDRTEIRGLSFKNLIAVIVATATIVGSVLATSYAIKEQIVTLNINYQRQNEMNDLRYRSYDQRLEHDENDITDIRKQQESITLTYKNK